MTRESVRQWLDSLDEEAYQHVQREIVLRSVNKTREKQRAEKQTREGK